MKRTFSVDRVFPLGDYKNVKYGTILELESNEELEEALQKYSSVESIYRALTMDLYQAFFDHSELREEMNQANSLAEKKEVFRNAR